VTTKLLVVPSSTIPLVTVCHCAGASEGVAWSWQPAAVATLGQDIANVDAQSTVVIDAISRNLVASAGENADARTAVINNVITPGHTADEIGVRAIEINARLHVSPRLEAAGAGANIIPLDRGAGAAQQVDAVPPVKANPVALSDAWSSEHEVLRPIGVEAIARVA